MQASKVELNVEPRKNDIPELTTQLEDIEDIPILTGALIFFDNSIFCVKNVYRKIQNI